MKKNQPIPTGEIEIAEAQEIKSRKLKYGTLATVFTIVFILAVILVNVFVGYLTDRFVLEFDMTSEDLFDISEDTREVLADISEPITITVLAEETDYRDSTSLLAQIYEILQRYEALSNGMLTVEYINPELNPQLLDKYAELDSPSTDDIIIESSKRFKHLTPTDLYEYQTDSSTDESYIVGLRAEQRLTSGILFVQADSIPKALFTTGHGETTSLDELKSVLTSGNYEVGTVSLGTEEIPDDATMLIISSPETDFTDDEIDRLDEFLTNGGNAIVTMTPSTTSTLTRLESYFEEWGVSYDKSMIMDNTQCLAGYPMYIVPTLQSVEGITDSISTTAKYATIPGAMPINTLFSENGWRTTTSLLTTSSASYAKEIVGESILTYDKETGDAEGPFNVAVMAMETHVDNLQYSYSRILFANAGMVSDSVMSYENMLNSQYVAAVISMMTDETDAVIIEAKNYESTSLTILGTQVTTLFWVMIIIIPFGILAIGLVIWLRRRHL
jgi:hypothetical protein